MVQVWLIRESKTTGIASYFADFVSEVSAKDELKLRCENVKLFLREPLVIGKSDGANNFCMRFFELSEGGYTPKHYHEWEHEIIIHSGKGEVLSQDKWIPVTKGHVIFIPGNEEHQIKNASQDPLVFACLIPAGPPEL